MNQISIHNKTKDWYLSNLDIMLKKLNGKQNKFFNEFREEAVRRFRELNFPTRKDEEWKYTDVSPILEQNFVPSVFLKNPTLTIDDIKKYLFTGFDFYLATFINGIFVEELSDLDNLPKGVIVRSLNKLVNENTELLKNYLNKISNIDNIFNALNNIYALDGIVILTDEKVVVDKPIQILFLNGNTENQILSTPKNLIIAGKNSQLSVIMNYKGFGNFRYFTNSVTEVLIDDYAAVDYYKIQDEKDDSFHIEKIHAVQKNNSIFNQFNLSFGGNLVRNDINSYLNGEYNETHYYGLYLAKGKQHIDNHTFVDHAKPNCMSNELYKGILDDNARGVFNGKIIVRPNAQKTNAYQQNKSILLSGSSRVDTKPQLEIFADDVKCTHGATVGHLDEEAEFYIRSRGVPQELAKSILIRAFAYDVVEMIKIEELREQINHMIFEHLHRVEIQNQ